MIVTIESPDRVNYPQLIDEIFYMRAEVFSGRLGWEVTVTDGGQSDRFDDDDPLYLIALDETTGSPKGAVRLLPTTRPNMLRDMLRILKPKGAPESLLI